VLTAVVPVVGAVVLWQVTGSAFALWFAALGPLLAGAALLDGLRGARRTRRLSRREAEHALDRIESAVQRRHDGERRMLWSRHPDVAGFVDDPAEIWRAVPGRADALVVARGQGSSVLRLEGDGDTARARELRRVARTVADVPVLIPLSAGVAVTGPPVLAAAVLRGLMLQLCLAHPPGDLRAAGRATQGLPHAQATSGTLLYCGDGGRPIPADVDVPLILVEEGSPPPPRCAAVLTVATPRTARLDHAGVSQEVGVEAISAEQADLLATALVERARASVGQRTDGVLGLDELLETVPPGPRSVLAATVAVSAGEPVVLDLVDDGPHAVVIGVTGSGKSELLTSWIAALCHGRSAAEVSFLLVDFKGGRTFEALDGLPHVTGVLTDLDEEQAVRAIESLRAEIRHRERVLAEHGAREIGDVGGALARLVIVVDEYAALVASHPELHDLFGDIAARGRALGMHVILASQRAAGFRDAVLANAPLRIGFRVTDAADSRAVLGTDEAAHLSGLSSARGVALVRRAADAAPSVVRVARCAPDTIARIVRESDPRRARAPWLPSLPTRIPLEDIRRQGSVVLGREDAPARQAQPVLLWEDGLSGFAVVGGPGSGKTTLLRVVAAQVPGCLWVSADPEAAWDQVAALDAVPAGTVVLVDDADALAARLPAEYAADWLSRVERLAREARGRDIGLAFSSARLSGSLARAAELLPRRAILAVSGRAEHVAAGGEAADFVAGLPAGRGRWGRGLAQFADTRWGPPEGATVASWRPGRRPTAFIGPAGVRMRAVVEGCSHAGLTVTAVEDVGAEPAAGGLLWGSPEAWLAHWRVLAAARAEGDVVVDAACAAEYRTLTGHRDLPPYALAGAGRAWLLRPGRQVTRVLLPPG